MPSVNSVSAPSLHAASADGPGRGARSLMTQTFAAMTRGWPSSAAGATPIGTIPEQDLLALLIEPPEWAVGLPLGGKVRSGRIYLEAPATAEPSAAQPSIEHA